MVFSKVLWLYADLNGGTENTVSKLILCVEALEVSILRPKLRRETCKIWRKMSETVHTPRKKVTSPKPP